MGHWGFKSYENDEAADAIDAALEQVHGDEYDRLMDDRNPTPFEKVQDQLLNAETLAAALSILEREHGTDPNTWDELARLAFAGIVVRHAERKVPIPGDRKDLAIQWLESEDIEWDEATKRRLRKQNEIDLLNRASETS